MSVNDMEVGSRDVEVSIVIPVYNGWNYLRRLLASLGSVPPSWEIIILDDASPDNEGAAIQAGFPQVKVMRRTLNGGFAAAVNSGVSASRGRIILLLNSDVQISLEDAKVLVNSADVHKGIAGPRTLDAQGDPIRTVYAFPSPWRQPFEVTPLARLLRRIPKRTPSNSRSIWLVGSVLAFPRAAYDRIGPFPEEYGMYSEEVDWQKRAASLEIDRILEPDATAQHDESHGTERFSKRADVRYRAVWRARQTYFKRTSGSNAALVFNVLLLLFSIGSLPTWLPLMLPRHSRRIADSEASRLLGNARESFAELRRLSPSVGATRR